MCTSIGWQLFQRLYVKQKCIIIYTLSTLYHRFLHLCVAHICTSYIYIYVYTWNPNDLYFWRSTPQSKAFSNQNKDHLGSRHIYIYLYMYICMNEMHDSNVSWYSTILDSWTNIGCSAIYATGELFSPAMEACPPSMVPFFGFHSRSD